MDDCEFSGLDAVRERTGARDGFVCLFFTNCEDRCLYAHHAFLSAWSGVLKNVLEDTEGDEPLASTPGRSSSSSISSTHQSGCRTIPLDDSGTAAWEDCLALMHPSRVQFKMDWVKAERLLMLAHKYDMPAVTGELTSLDLKCWHQQCMACHTQ
jgi:hypothetical protein